MEAKLFHQLRHQILCDNEMRDRHTQGVATITQGSDLDLAWSDLDKRSARLSRLKA